MNDQIVVFELGTEQFGVDISSVESIIKMQAITKMPHAPAFVEGVTNLRGKVLPVIDLRKRFGMASNEVDKDNRIIVISVNRTEVGMVVDGVSEVFTVPDQAVEPAPSIATTVDSAFITGIAKLDGRLVILLDLDRVLTIQEQSDLESLRV
ncbi:MAG TPA: chemotaxis protein CheW [Anaerolineaceae bacterium]|nr:chemotaxis protein CheW [Anaerolineaceae bacterium]